MWRTVSSADRQYVPRTSTSTPSTSKIRILVGVRFFAAVTQSLEQKGRGVATRQKPQALAVQPFDYRKPRLGLRRVLVSCQGFFMGGKRASRVAFSGLAAPPIPCAFPQGSVCAAQSAVEDVLCVPE